MKKILILFTLFIIGLSSNLNAAAYKGQRLYTKNCLKCHGREEFVLSKTKAQWQQALSNNGKTLANLHLKSQKAQDSWKFFKSKKYYKKLKHLKDFFSDYAKDSGKVPIFNK